MTDILSALTESKLIAGQTRHAVVWSETRLDLLRRTVRGELRGYSNIDPRLSSCLLQCAVGEFDEAEADIIKTLHENIGILSQDPEVFISLLNALFVVQRLDLVSLLLCHKFKHSGCINLSFSELGTGMGVVRWDISSEGTHRFVFDTAVLRNDNTRAEIVNFYWEFPLFARYAAQPDQETGSVLLNREDVGKKPGLAYCDNRPDFFLIPDAGFVSSDGYDWCRRVLAKNRLPWDDRLPVAFWRGATTGMRPGPRDWRALERIRLCEIARRHQHTSLFDVGISNIVQFSDPDVIQEIMESGLVLGRVPWEDWGRYKYLIDIDGNSSPYSNLHQRLLTGSPVLKVESSRGLLQWFYGELVAWVNYVPIAADMSDLLDKVRWLNRNDTVAREIGERGRLLAENMTIERELGRSVATVSAAFRYFRDPAASPPPAALPYGMPPRAAAIPGA